MHPEAPQAGLDRRGFLRDAARLGLGLLGWPAALARAAGRPASRAAPAGASLASRLLVFGTVTGTGPLAPFGRAIGRGLRLWADRAASRAASGGPAFVLELAEDTGRPGSVLEHAAAAAERAHVFIGPYGSELAAALLPLCRREGIPLLLPGAADPSLDLSGPAGSPPIGFALLPPNDRALAGAVEWAAARGARSVALLFREDPFSLRAAQGARRRAEELNLTVAWDRTFTRADQIWEPSFELFGHGGSESGRGGPGSSPPAVDLLLGGGFLAGAEAQGFLPDAREITLAFSGKARHLALLIAPTFEAFRRAVGARAEGVLGNTLWKPWFPTPGNADFAASFRERWGNEPDAHAAAAYAAGQIVEAAAETAVSLMMEQAGPSVAAGAGGLAAARLALRRALAALRTSTVFGPFSVDGEGRQQGHAYSILQWQGGRLESVWPPAGPGVSGRA